MALRPLGLLDLSIVTDHLRELIDTSITTSPLWSTLGLANPPTITVTGAMPEAVRKDGGCQVSVYLVHVAEDKYQRNSPVAGLRGQPLPYQPLSLNLYYLVTAFADKDYHLEQRAMSIILRCFHENPIIREDVVIPAPPAQTVNEEFVLTMEVETSDEMARLWQAVTAPFRLSVVYKVSVVFLTPPAPTAAVAPKPQRISLAVDPTLLPFAQNGQVIGTLRTVTFTPPDSTPAEPKTVSFDSAPATVAPGQRFLLYGANLNKPASRQVYLLLPDGAEQDVTNWKVAEPFPQPDPLHPPQFQTESKITLDLPATVGALPAGSPLPGVYQLRVGDAATIRSNATPFSIAARVNVTVAPPNPPILTPVAGLFTLTGVGFVAGHTELLLDTLPLTAAAGAPTAGQFNVDADGTVISFRAPDNLHPGRYTVRVRVNHVESAPSWWVNL